MPKILYIEDNEDNVYMLTERLRRRGFEVIVAHEGMEGLAMARNESPDLLIMDLGLPGLDGWEATRRLRADPEIRHLPVLALSAHAMPDERDRAIGAGCDDFDTKPVNFNRLLQKIAALLS